MKLFERVVELTVGDTAITGLHVAFEIEKDESPEPNPCHIEIYNLSAENRATLSKYQRVPVLLKAGYQGAVGVLFMGDMLRCAHIKEGATWKTVLASGDSALAMQTKRINKSYAKDTPVKTVVEDLAKQMGLKPAGALEHFEELNQMLSRSFVVSGNPMGEVVRLLGSVGIQASIQNQALQMRKAKKPLQKEAISLNADSGLLATPEAGSKGELTVRSLLMPELLPGRQVHIASTTYTGFATIQTVRFTGSNFGSDWEAEMNCKAKH